MNFDILLLDPFLTIYFQYKLNILNIQLNK